MTLSLYALTRLERMPCQSYGTHCLGLGNGGGKRGDHRTREKGREGKGNVGLICLIQAVT